MQYFVEIIIEKIIKQLKHSARSCCLTFLEMIKDSLIDVFSLHLKGVLGKECLKYFLRGVNLVFRDSLVGNKGFRLDIGHWLCAELSPLQ